MIKKIFAYGLVCVLILTTIFGTINLVIKSRCTPKDERDLAQSDRFIIVEESPLVTIYCDSVTGVLYMARPSGLTVLLNEQGLPLIYDEG